MKVSAILKGKPDQLGRLPVVIRIAEGKKRTYHTTPFKCLEDSFHNGKIDNDEATNSKIRALALRYESMLLEGKKKYRDSEFFDYVDKCLKEWDKVRAYNTMRNYKAETEKIKGFRSSFKLSEVNNDFLNGYSNYLYSLGNISTTVWTSFKFLRTVILKAHRERVIEENPFATFKIQPYKDPPKEYLTKDEVHQIEKWLPKSGSLRLCATWFVIGCYTGLRYSDMNAFSKERNIRNNRIVLTTVKTKDVVSMPVSKKLQKLFESINYQPMFISNQKFNDALKEIGKKLALGELSCHKSRHTFGVLCADAGISQEVTARLMGHRSLKSTATYYKITNPRIDKEIKKLG
jgi:integrase